MSYYVEAIKSVNVENVGPMTAHKEVHTNLSHKEANELFWKFHIEMKQKGFWTAIHMSLEPGTEPESAVPDASS